MNELRVYIVSKPDKDHRLVRCSCGVESIVDDSVIISGNKLKCSCFKDQLLWQLWGEK